MVGRPHTGIFSSNMWEDTINSFCVDDQRVEDSYAETIKELKEKVRSLLVGAEGNTMTETIILIDTIKRLGLGYHFEDEINIQLERIYEFHHLKAQEYDLFTTALLFRILRQHHFNVPCDVFDIFKDKKDDGKFDENLIGDVKGLLSLYEATHLRIHGENILEEALVFTTHYLNCMLPQLVSPLRDQVMQGLDQPCHKGIPRMEARKYISLYENNDAKNEIIFKLAKLDYNFLQNLYKKELVELTRWSNKWSDLDSKVVPHLRDRVLESYLWGIAALFEPQYSYARIAYTKCCVVLTKINDIYDNYATIEEVQLFTDIIQRWDINEADGLPADYMKVIYESLLDLYKDYERECFEQDKVFAVPYAIEAMKEICREYLRRMKWFLNREMPTFDEYISKHSWITNCIPVLYSMVILGFKSFKEEHFDWLNSTGDEPSKLVLGSSIVARCMNDVSGYERERRDGSAITGIDIYMNHYGVSKQVAMEKFVDLIEDGWKDATTEWIAYTNHTIPKGFFEGILNYGRASSVFFKNGSRDGFTYPELMVTEYHALFVDPITI